MIVANSPVVAIRAAALVQIVYASLDYPILPDQKAPASCSDEQGGVWSVQQALAQGRQYIETHHFEAVTTDYSNAQPRQSSDSSFNATISTTGQKHFYMETQSAFVSPGTSVLLLSFLC